MNGGQQHRASWLQSWHRNWHLGAPDMSSVSDGINWLWRKRDRTGEVAQASKLTLQDWRQSSGRRGLQHDKCWWMVINRKGEGIQVFWPAGVDSGNTWSNSVIPTGLFIYPAVLLQLAYFIVKQSSINCICLRMNVCKCAEKDSV